MQTKNNEKTVITGENKNNISWNDISCMIQELFTIKNIKKKHEEFNPRNKVRESEGTYVSFF